MIQRPVTITPPKEATRLSRRWREKGLSELGLFNLGKRRLWGGFIVTFQGLKGTYRKNGTTYKTML